MATLLALPNEILLNIIEELLPDDLPYFALSCKRMQTLSQESLTLYRECKKKYAVVKFHGCPERDNESDLPALLQHIIADQKVAYYPRSMIFEAVACSMECIHTFEYSPGNGDNDHSNNEAKRLGSIEKLNGIINQFDIGTTRTNDETTDQRLEAGKVCLYKPSQWSTMLGLLLTTFPNIETLTLKYSSELIILVQDLLWSAVEKNRGPGHTGPTFFTKLKTVIVDASVFGGLEDSDVFACFALFPSVEHLIAKRIASPPPLSSNISWTISEYLRLWHPSLAVTEVDFQDSSLTFEFFSQLLRDITRLKRFKYSFGRDLWGNSAPTDTYRLIDLLLLHSKTTLEYLEIRGFGYQAPSPPNGTGYGCLRDFKALKEVCVHAALWTIPETHYQAFSSELGYTRCEGRIVFPLVEMLPSCVETVHLEGPFHMLGVYHLLADLTMLQARHLPRLKTIAFSGVVRPSASMLKCAKNWMDLYARMGICLDFECNEWFSDLIVEC